MKHSWPRTARPAMALQERLRGRISIGDHLGAVRRVAGADIAYDPSRDRLYAAVLVFSFPSLEPIEWRAVTARIRFPYVPGLLSFREVPALLAAWRLLKTRPDLLICDGQGIAHPRGIGLASHLGLLLDRPTIGCAKSRLVGRHGPVGVQRGARASLVHGGRVVGTVLRTRPGVKPLYISPGHRIGLGDSVRYVLACTRGFRLPEPVRQADRLVAGLRAGRAIETPGAPRGRKSLC